MTEEKQTSYFRAEVSHIIGEGYYGYQQMRIQTMNRIRNLIHRRWQGLSLSEVQKKKPEDEKYIEEFKDKNIPEYIRILNEHGELTNEEKEYVSKAYEAQKRAKQQEKDYQKLMRDFIEVEPIYQQFLSKIRGISQVLSTNLVKEFGYCEKARYVSSLWKYVGMHVENGRAPQRKSGQKLDFSIRLRSIVWNVGDSFVKQRTPYYREIYDQEKERQKSRPPERVDINDSNRIKGDLLAEKVGKFKKGTRVINDNYSKVKEAAKEEGKDSILIDLSPGHLSNRALRKMIKIFLAHYWQCAKELSGQEKPEPYVQEKMGHQHISNWKEAVESQLKKKADDTVKK